jgi:hypothetical protein
MLAARVALAAAAARAALALHSTLYSEPAPLKLVHSGSAPNQDVKPAVYEHSAAAADGALITDLEETPPEVQADLDNRRRKMEQLAQDRESVAVDAHKTDNHKRHQSEQSLWLSGKSRQAMTNYDDVQYISFMEVGNQTISGIIDTGSFELVVFSTFCATCGQAGRYNPRLSASHTPGKLATVQMYGSGDLFVQEAWDTVSIGPFTPKHQSFWEVTSAKMPVLQYSAFQSIIGIGPPETPALDAEEQLQVVIQNISNYKAMGLPVPNSLQKEFEDKQKISVAMKNKSTMVDTFGTNMYSICFGRKPGSDGYVIWSDTAPLVKPEYFIRAQVVGKHTWSVQLTEPRFVHDPAAKTNKYEGVTLGCADGCGALLDSGSSLLAIPGDTVNTLVQVSLEPWFNCDSWRELPSIKLKLGGQEILLPPDMYVAESVDTNVPEYLQSFVRLRKLRVSNHKGSGRRCELVIMESGADTAHGPLWILGAPFFRQFYTTFEIGGHSNERRAVHIARASDTCTPAADPGSLQKFVPPTQLYKRIIDPSKLFVPPSVQSALNADYVKL